MLFNELFLSIFVLCFFVAHLFNSSAVSVKFDDARGLRRFPNGSVFAVLTSTTSCQVVDSRVNLSQRNEHKKHRGKLPVLEWILLCVEHEVGCLFGERGVK